MYIKKSSPVFFVEFIYLMFNGFLFLILKICWMALVIPLVWCYAIYGFFFLEKKKEANFGSNRRGKEWFELVTPLMRRGL